MSDEVVVIAETAEVLADAVISVVDAAAQAARAIKETVPRSSKRRPPPRRGDRGDGPEVIKAAIEPDVVVDEAARVYNYVVTCMAYGVARARRLHRRRVAALRGARRGARGAAPRGRRRRRGGGSWRAWAACRPRTRRRGTRL